MNDLLRECREFAQVYIDDIVIHSASLEDHVAHIKKVMTLLRSEKLYAKRKSVSLERKKLISVDSWSIATASGLSRTS